MSIPQRPGTAVSTKVKWTTPVGVGSVLLCIVPQLAAHPIPCNVEGLKDNDLESATLLLMLPPGTVIAAGLQFELYSPNRVKVGEGITTKGTEQ